MKVTMDLTSRVAPVQLKHGRPARPACVAVPARPACNV
jgi:hypothetical protein